MSHHSNHPPNQGSLVCNANGDPIPHLANCLKVLEEAESCLAYNELKHAATLTGVPPWRLEDEDDIVPAVDDIQVLQALVWVQRHKNGLAANKDTVGQALEVIARRHPFHPVRNMLTGLVWDGHDRLDDWMIQFLDAPDTGFVRRAGRYTLIGAVARVMDPGCRFDTVLVLEGPQGEYKSTVVEILGGDWYLDGLGSEGKMDKEAVIAMAGFWIIELAEIDYHLRQNNASALKAFYPAAPTPIGPCMAAVRCRPRASRSSSAPRIRICTWSTPPATGASFPSPSSPRALPQTRGPCPTSCHSSGPRPWSSGARGNATTSRGETSCATWRRKLRRGSSPTPWTRPWTSTAGLGMGGVAR
jgi:hypothetical protein